MRRILTLGLFVCSFAFAQAGPEMVVATVNGRKITAADFENLLKGLTPANRAAAEKNPRQFLQQQALFENVVGQAEKLGLPNESPYKEQLASARRQILMQARVDRRSKEIVVTAEDQKKHYAANKTKYAQVKAKVIFISSAHFTQRLADQKITSTRTPEQSRELASKIVKQVKEGADFVKLAAEFSDDGNGDKGADFPTPIRADTETVPADIRKAVLEAKPNDIVGPIDHATGHYIFKIVSNDIATYDEARSSVYRELLDLGLRKWFEEMTKASPVTIENEAFFKQ